MRLGREIYMPNKENKCVANVIFECTADLSELDTCRYFTPHKADPTLCVTLALDGNLNLCTRESAMKDARANRKMSNYAKKILTI